MEKIKHDLYWGFISRRAFSFSIGVWNDWLDSCSYDECILYSSYSPSDVLQFRTWVLESDAGASFMESLI